MFRDSLCKIHANKNGFQFTVNSPIVRTFVAPNTALLLRQCGLEKTPGRVQPTTYQDLCTKTHYLNRREAAAVALFESSEVKRFMSLKLLSSAVLTKTGKQENTSALEKHRVLNSSFRRALLTVYVAAALGCEGEKFSCPDFSNIM